MGDTGDAGREAIGSESIESSPTIADGPEIGRGVTSTVARTDAEDAGRGTLAFDVVSANNSSQNATEAGDPPNVPNNNSHDVQGARPLIAGYEIECELGRGGMGVVYRARQVRLNRPCALKLILAGAHADPIARIRFLGEAEAVGKVQHPNIVQIYAIGEAGGLPYLELEYLPGGSLDRVLDGTPWPARRAARLVESLARGVAEAHRVHTIHRDIKPGNILMAADGTPKIADFGLAKSVNIESGLTATGSILGSPSYMAPEQAGGDSTRVGPLADVYALGAILYELLVGRPPFRGATVMDTLDQVKAAEPVAPSQLIRGLPRDVEVIVSRCLQKDPAKRYDSAQSLAEDLRRFQAGEPILARPVGRLERSWRWCRRHPSRAIAAGAVAAALGAVMIVSLLYAQSQHRFALEQAAASGRITSLATGLERERVKLARSLKDSNRRLAIQHAERGQLAFEKGHIGPGLLWTLEAWRSADEADDPAWRSVARANLAAWAAGYPTLRAVFSHDAPIVRLALSPDGKVVAIAGDDSTTRLWDVSTASPIGPVIHRRSCYGLAFSPDGKTLAMGLNDVQFRDPASGELRSTVPFPEEISSLAFSPDGSKLLVCGYQGATQLWHLPDASLSGSLAEKPGAIVSAAFSPDGKTILTGTREGEIRLWDALTGQPLGPPFPRFKRIPAVAFSPGGESLLTGDYNGIARHWGFPSQRPIDPPMVHAGEIRIVAFSPDGKTILTGSVDRTARLWDSVTHAPVGPIYEHQGPIEAGAISPDGEWVLTGGGDRTARVWKLDRGQRETTRVRPQGVIHAAAFGPDGKTFLTGSNDGTAQIWDSATGRPVGAPMTHPGEVWAVALSPDGKTAVTGCTDRVARLWDVATSKPREMLGGHGHVVSVVAFSPDGKLVLTGAQDGQSRLWDAATGALIGKPLPCEGGVDAGAFSRDGKYLATGVDLGTVRIWEVETQSQVGEPIKYPGAVSGVAFAPDGRSLLIGGEDGTAGIWDLATRTRSGPPLQHGAWVMAVAFSADGKRLLTGSWDKTARLWDAATGMPIGPPMVHPDRVWAVAFSPDGTHVLTGCDDRQARLFPVVPELPDDFDSASVWTEVITGLTLDSHGTTQVLDNATWRARRQRLEELGGPPTASTRP
jgi:WD40 repeat protein